jgi:hypothetical protein
VKTSPAATPVTMTTIDPADPPKSRFDLLPVTAFESVTPEQGQTGNELKKLSQKTKNFEDCWVFFIGWSYFVFCYLVEAT